MTSQQPVEVRATHLRPAEFRERRDAFPAAWLPVGTIEWHGTHLPLGLDGLKSEGLCIEGARALGGVVFPGMYYGDPRTDVLETISKHGGIFTEIRKGSGQPPDTYDHRIRVNEELGTSVNLMASLGRREVMVSAHAQHRALILRAFWMIRAYGFSRIVAICGHGPNGPPTAAAAAEFHAAQTSCRVFHGNEYEHGGRGGGDHAGAGETSALLVLYPELVAMDRVDQSSEPLGIFGDHPKTASVERGREIVDGIIETMRERLGQPPPMISPDGPDEDGCPPDWPDLLQTAPAEVLREAVGISPEHRDRILGSAD